MVRVLHAAVFIALLSSPAAGDSPVQASEAPRPNSAPAISVAEVTPALLRDRAVASGFIGPVERVLVQPEIEGQAIEEILAEVGDRVTQGEVLAILSDRALLLQKSQLAASRAAAEASIAQAAAQLVEAEANAVEAERVRDRTEALREQGTSSQAMLDQVAAAATSAVARATAARQGLIAAEAQLAVVQAQSEDIELRLSRTKIVAPVAGEITGRSARVGAIASAAGEPLFVIAREGLLELVVDVAEQDILRLAEGQKVTLRTVGLQDTLTGTLRLVEPTVDAASRLGRARITLDEPQRVREGLFAEAEILIAERQALAVPVTAVGTVAGEATVLKVDQEGRVERVTVVTGIRDGARIEIISGLSEGDRIVARAGAFVRPGDLINPILAPASGPVD